MATDTRSRVWSWVWRALKVAPVIVAVAGVVYWMKFSPVPVIQHQVEQGEIVAEVMGTGTLEAHFKSIISPRIAGRLKEVLVDQGDVVKSGDLLVQARRRGYEAAGGDRPSVGGRLAVRARSTPGRSRPSPSRFGADDCRTQTSLGAASTKCDQSSRRSTRSRRTGKSPRRVSPAPKPPWLKCANNYSRRKRTWRIGRRSWATPRSSPRLTD